MFFLRPATVFIGPRVSTSRFQVNIDSSKSKLRPKYESTSVPTTKMRLLPWPKSSAAAAQQPTHTYRPIKSGLFENMAGEEIGPMNDI